MMQVLNIQNAIQYQYIDLTILNETGRQKLIDFYNELIKQFYEPKQEDNENDFYKSILWLSEYNDNHLVTVSKDINISELANEMNDVIF